MDKYRNRIIDYNQEIMYVIMGFFNYNLIIYCIFLFSKPRNLYWDIRYLRTRIR